MPEKRYISKLTKDKIIKAIRANNVILKRFKVKKIGLFGSYIHGEQDKTSDIDFLVEFYEPTFDNFMDLAFTLEELFGRKVDLVTNGNLSPYIKPYIDEEVIWCETE
jgi:uncharacterized protein